MKKIFICTRRGEPMCSPDSAHTRRGGVCPPEYTHTTAKGRQTLPLPWMGTPGRHIGLPLPWTVILLLSSFIFQLSSCTSEDVVPSVQRDALAEMPAETPISISAQISALHTRAASETYYADNEIHLTTEGIALKLAMPGGSDETWLNNYGASIQNLPNTEPFSQLQLKDFNLTEGDGRCVSRWTYLEANNDADCLFGFARLEAGADGKPVLDYGELTHASTKVTIRVVTSQGDPVPVLDDNGNQIREDTLHFPFRTAVTPIYLTDEAGNGTLFDVYCGEGITTLAADEAITSDDFALAVFKYEDKPLKHILKVMKSADGSKKYCGEKGNELSNIVPPTATHTKEETAPGVSATRYFPIENPSFTGDEKLTITVKQDPDGDGPLTTGTYTLKLKDIQVESGKMTDESAEQNFPLSSFNLGTHYVITVTLDHNRLATGTAQLASWNYTEAEATLGGDPSALPTVDGSTTDEEVWKAIIKEAAEKGGALVVTGTTLAVNAVYSCFADVSSTLVRNGEVPAGSIDLILPDVTELQDWAFKDCTILRSVSAPKLTKIGQYTFSDCSSLSSVSLPEATSIGTIAFSSCTSLTGVSLPKATTIGATAFSSCTSLTGVSLPKATTIGDNVFEDCTALTGIELPAATSIGKYVFKGCTALSTVSLPLVTTVEGYTFGSCTALTGLTFGSVLTSVVGNTFENASTTTCTLTLAEGQKMLDFWGVLTDNDVTAAAPDASETDRTWAGCVWKEIIITPSTNE